LREREMARKRKKERRTGKGEEGKEKKRIRRRGKGEQGGRRGVQKEGRGMMKTVFSVKEAHKVGLQPP
jgi:hypothetical protein